MFKWLALSLILLIQPSAYASEQLHKIECTSPTAPQDYRAVDAYAIYGDLFAIYSGATHSTTRMNSLGDAKLVQRGTTMTFSVPYPATHTPPQFTLKLTAPHASQVIHATGAFSTAQLGMVDARYACTFEYVRYKTKPIPPLDPYAPCVPSDYTSCEPVTNCELNGGCPD